MSISIQSAKGVYKWILYGFTSREEDNVSS